MSSTSIRFERVLVTSLSLASTLGSRNDVMIISILSIGVKGEGLVVYSLMILMTTIRRCFFPLLLSVQTVVSAYLPIIEKRKDTPFTAQHKAWQQLRRGRYLEFNLEPEEGSEEWKLPDACINPKEWI